MGASLNGKGYVAEINVTPFVDVMLVLLIIFMVTAPMMTQGLDLQLPETTMVETLPTDSENVVLTLSKNGTIYLNEYKTPRENLFYALNATVKSRNKQLFLQADKDVPYGDVVYIMGKIREAGIERLSIVAERLDEDVPATQPATPARSRAGGR